LGTKGGTILRGNCVKTGAAYTEETYSEKTVLMSYRTYRNGFGEKYTTRNETDAERARGTDARSEGDRSKRGPGAPRQESEGRGVCNSVPVGQQEQGHGL